MQLAIRPWITAAIVLAATGAIAVTPVVAPDTEHRAVALTTIGQDISDLQEILAGVIDPGLAGAPAQAADAAATTDLGSTGASEVLAGANSNGADAAVYLGEAEQAITASPPDFVGAQGFDGDAATPSVGGAADDAGNAQADAVQAAAALSAADPIQVFQADLQADLSQPIGDLFSSTTLNDLIATLNAAPAAAEEYLAELIDPAAAGQVTAYDDANMAAELAATAQQQYDDAFSALQAVQTADPTMAAGDTEIAIATAQAVTEVSAANTAADQAATSITDAINALDSATPTVTLADLGTDLGTLWSSLLADLGL